MLTESLSVRVEAFHWNALLCSLESAGIMPEYPEDEIVRGALTLRRTVGRFERIGGVFYARHRTHGHGVEYMQIHTPTVLHIVHSELITTPEIVSQELEETEPSLKELTGHERETYLETVINMAISQFLDAIVCMSHRWVIGVVLHNKYHRFDVSNVPVLRDMPGALEGSEPCKALS